jgi:hypothetical protein
MVGSGIFMKLAVKTALGGTIHMPSLMMIVSGIQVILRLISKLFERSQCWYY